MINQLLALSPLNFMNNTMFVTILAIGAGFAGWVHAMNKDRLLLPIAFMFSLLVMFAALANIRYFEPGPNGLPYVHGAPSFVATLLVSLTAATWLAIMAVAWIRSRRLRPNYTVELYGCLSMASTMVASHMWYEHTELFTVVNAFNALSQWILLASLVTLFAHGLIHFFKKENTSDNAAKPMLA